MTSRAVHKKTQMVENQTAKVKMFFTGGVQGLKDERDDSAGLFVNL